uniref:Uncharacterized protein n=1 Tax=Rhizophora mucronata TaxID=61149 RepID=A0A2P2JXN7_RHIMU
MRRVVFGVMVRLIHCDLEVISSSCGNIISVKSRGKLVYV